MKKLLLTSSGLDNENLKQEFLHILTKPIDKARVLLIYGAKTKEEMFYVNESKDELIGIGIKKENILEANINKDLSQDYFNGIDVIYFCGGNTYYLLDRIRKIKFDKLIIDFISKEGLYIGVSAGSIIAGEDIKIAGWGSEGDKNEVGLKDLRGLGFTDIAIFPHYKDSMKKELEEFRKKANYQVKELKDGEAILILNDEVIDLK